MSKILKERINFFLEELYYIDIYINFFLDSHVQVGCMPE